MKTSKQSQRDARQLLRSCMVNNALDGGRARQAVQRVIQDRPRGYMGVLSNFQRLVRLEIARRAATIESATPLTAQTRAQIQSDLSRQYGPGLEFAFLENPALIGGIRIQVGGDVYNGSVQGRLEALREAF